MPPRLTEEQQHALDAQPEIPPRVIDERTNTTYVLISLEDYERIKPLFEEDPITEAEMRYLLAEGGKAAGWDDPEMDVYDDYDAHRPQP